MPRIHCNNLLFVNVNFWFSNSNFSWSFIISYEIFLFSLLVWFSSVMDFVICHSTKSFLVYLFFALAREIRPPLFEWKSCVPTDSERAILFHLRCFLLSDIVCFSIAGYKVGTKTWQTILRKILFFFLFLYGDSPQCLDFQVNMSAIFKNIFVYRLWIMYAIFTPYYIYMKRVRGIDLWIMRKVKWYRSIICTFWLHV